jgi:hypothetical protein
MALSYITLLYINSELIAIKQYIFSAPLRYSTTYIYGADTMNIST